jgi:hypothetical protein
MKTDNIAAVAPSLIVAPLLLSSGHTMFPFRDGLKSRPPINAKMMLWFQLGLARWGFQAKALTHNDCNSSVHVWVAVLCKSQDFCITPLSPPFQWLALCKRYLQKCGALLGFRHGDFWLCPRLDGRPER